MRAFFALVDAFKVAHDDSQRAHHRGQLVEFSGASALHKNIFTTVEACVENTIEEVCAIALRA